VKAVVEFALALAQEDLRVEQGRRHRQKPEQWDRRSDGQREVEQQRRHDREQEEDDRGQQNKQEVPLQRNRHPAV